MIIRNLSFLFLLPLFFTAQAQDHTVWRNGTDGIYQGSGLLNSWPESGPVVLWSFDGLGQGHSSPTIYKDHIYTSGMLDGTGFLFKLNMDGTLVYKREYGPEFTESFYGTRGTPVIDGNRVYQVSGHGKLICMQESDGEKIWEVDMVKEFEGEVIRWGYNETPVIDGNIIYCTPGGKNSVIALDKMTGKLIWSCPGEGELSAYCTPLLFEHHGRKILATHTASHLLGIDAATGKLLWSHPQPNKWSVHANTPIYHDGGLYYFSGYGQGGGKITLSDDGTTVKQAWKNPMDSRMGGAVLIDGVIYASGDMAREWRAIDWKTGEDLWVSSQVGKGVTIAADGKLYGYTDKGELVMAKATSENFELLGLARVTLGSEQHWAHPVIYNGVLYLRHGKSLIAYSIK